LADRTDNLKLRAARPSDAANLAAIMRAAYAPFSERIPDLPDVASGLADDIRQHDVWLALLAALPRGGVVISHAGERAHLVNLAVHPKAAGRGLGRALIDLAVARARDKGARQLDLATHVMMPENVALYRHLGWQETGRQGNKVFMSRALHTEDQ